MFVKLGLLCFVVGCVFAAPQGVVPLEKQQPTVIPIINQSEELEANGTYKFSYETANGIKREETSYSKVVPKVEGRSGGSKDSSESNSDESDEIRVQQGSYSYTAPDGTIITVRYIADENGFQVFGDHLPKSPALVQQLQARSSGISSKALNSDNAESGSAPAAVTASKPVVPAVAAKLEEAPVKVESRSGSEASSEVVSTTAEVSQKTAAKDSASTSPAEKSTATEGSTAAESVSTEAPTATSEKLATEAASTASAESEETKAVSTTAVEQSTTEIASTKAAEPSSTIASEAATTTTQPSSESSTTETASATKST